ncbi:sensor histidine kinase [Paenibacillus lignilyticus]|uniref:Sensor histidine kinase n=1 Tax=Paenibacillus lignilyticus TaxID=1172615 RepID=A0ABS5CJE0_9BACL|nr:sensor histidine kinase [Paenibacillus lignilyticus]MBP3966002.1 sensor histidine kinase [Paenibacillus lignilyticus]
MLASERKSIPLRRTAKLRIPIFGKLVIAFMLVIIPMYTISLYLNQWGAASVRDEITKSMKGRVHFYIQSLVVEFERIQRLQWDFINDRDLQKLSVTSEIMSDNERTQAIIRLQERLALVKNSSNYIASFNAYIPTLGKVINSQNNYDSADQAYLQTLIDESGRIHPIVQSWRDRLFITQKYPDIGYPDSLTFFLNEEISKKAIRQELQQFSNIQGEQAILFGTDFNWSITNDDHADLIEHIRQVAKRLVKGDTVTAMDTIDFEGTPYLLTLEHEPSFDMTLVMYMPVKNALGPIAKYNLWLWVLSLTSFIIVLFFSYWIYRVIHKPLEQLVRTFRKVEKGQLDVRLNPTTRDEFEYLYSQFNSMIGRVNVLIEEVYEQQIRSQRSELKQLQAQINPHFLYNTFFILNRMVKVEDYPKLKPFTKHLGNYFKFITRDASDEVALREELAFAQSYLEIQKIRFEDRIQIDIEPLPARYADLLVPRLTLQPIIENCYKYGLEDVVSGGQLHISFKHAGGLLTVVIEDNGKGMSEEDMSALNRKLSHSQAQLETTGMINVHKRLQLMYGKDSGIRVTTGETLGGLKVELYIPVKEES